jgi:hypothetical protein
MGDSNCEECRKYEQALARARMQNDTAVESQLQADYNAHQTSHSQMRASYHTTTRPDEIYSTSQQDY